MGDIATNSSNKIVQQHFQRTPEQHCYGEYMCIGDIATNSSSARIFVYVCEVLVAERTVAQAHC